MRSADELRRELEDIDGRLGKFDLPGARLVLRPEARERVSAMRARRAELAGRLAEAELSKKSSDGGESVIAPGQKASASVASASAEGASAAGGPGEREAAGDSHGSEDSSIGASVGEGDWAVSVPMAEDVSAGAVSEASRERAIARIAEGSLTAEERTAYRNLLNRHRAYVESRSLLERDSMSNGIEREKSVIWEDYRRDLRALCEADAAVEGLAGAGRVRKRLPVEVARDIASAKEESVALNELGAGSAADDLREAVREAAARPSVATLKEKAPPGLAPVSSDHVSRDDAVGSIVVGGEVRMEEPSPAIAGGDRAVMKAGEAAGAAAKPDGVPVVGVETGSSEDSGEDGARLAGGAESVAGIIVEEGAFLDLPVKVSIVVPAERFPFMVEEEIKITLVEEGVPLERTWPSGVRIVGPVGFRQMAGVRSQETDALHAMLDEFVERDGRGAKVRTGVALPAASGESVAVPLFADMVLEAGSGVVVVQCFGTAGLDWRYSRREDQFVAGSYSLPGFMGDAYTVISRLRSRRRRESGRETADWRIVTVFYGGGSVDMSETAEDARGLFRWARMRSADGRQVLGDLEAVEKIFYELGEWLARTAPSAVAEKSGGRSGNGGAKKPRASR